MKLSKKTVLLSAAGVLVLGLLALGTSALVLPREYATEQIVERSFTIDLDFSTVRKILVRTDAAKRIITMTGDSEFVEQKWTALGGGLDLANLLDPKWRLDLRGDLTLRTLDDYIGKNEIKLSQDVKIDSDQLHSEVALKEGSPRLLDYGMTTWFVREASDGTTRVVQRLKQQILTDAPWFAHWVADRHVRKSAERSLVNQEQAIRKVIDDNRDNRRLLLQPSASATFIDADCYCFWISTQMPPARSSLCIRVNHSSFFHTSPNSSLVRRNSWRLYVRQHHTRLVQAPEKLSSVVNSSMRPPGRITRDSSANPGRASGRCSRTYPQVTQSKLSSANGRRHKSAAT